MKFFWVAGLAGALLGCPPSSQPPTPDAADAAPPALVDAGPAPLLDAAQLVDASPQSDACARGEAQLLALRCLDIRGRLLGGPNLHGVRWAQICRNNAMNGIDMHPECIAAKTSCSELVQCR